MGDLADLLNVPPEELERLLLENQAALNQILLVLAIGSALILLLHVLFSWMLVKCGEAIPAAHRKLPPWHAWLLVIPCFNIVWNFFVYPKLAQSFRACFEARERRDAGDCGEALGMWFSITYAAGNLVPFLGPLFLLAAMLLQLQYLVRAWRLRKELLNSAPAASGSGA